MGKKNRYTPPYSITSLILNLVSEISEMIGRYTVLAEQEMTPRLRRENRKWKPLLSFLPVETVIRDRQEQYYKVLAQADRESESTPFIEFMLQALLDAMVEVTATDQVTDQVTLLIQAIGDSELGTGDLMERLALLHRPTFRKNYLDPALSGGWIERTQPDSPRSPTQRYRLTHKGRQLLVSRNSGR